MLRFGKIRGIEAVEKFLKTLPRGGVRVALAAFTEYILGDTRHGLRHDEPQKYVSRKQAGYKTSAAQRRYFFAVGIWKKMFGEVAVRKYHRTGATAAAWQSVKVSDWSYYLANPKPGAYWTRDNTGQTRQHALAGRRKVSTVIAANLKGGLRHATAEINRWMRQNAK